MDAHDDGTTPGRGFDLRRRLLTSASTLPVRYWWVNQNQTHVQEQRGGYLWSPVHKANGSRNPFYDSMREISPGDVIFCFYRRRIRSVGIATSFCFDAPKPTEFGSKGDYWEDWGHRVSTVYVAVPRPLRPSDEIERLRPLLPGKYSPLQAATGHGLQGVYLTAVPDALASELLRLSGLDQRQLLDRRLREVARLGEYDGASVTGKIEEGILSVLRDAPDLTDTERQSQIQARVGQGEFRRGVLTLEKSCRVTGLRDPVHLIASHIKPWRACQQGQERVDGNNGLALAPHIDHLFDKGFVSFQDQGDLLVSPLLLPDVLEAFHVDPSTKVAAFRDEQAPYLEYHRDHVLRRAV